MMVKHLPDTHHVVGGPADEKYKYYNDGHFQGTNFCATKKSYPRSSNAVNCKRSNCNIFTK